MSSIWLLSGVKEPESKMFWPAIKLPRALLPAPVIPNIITSTAGRLAAVELLVKRVFLWYKGSWVRHGELPCRWKDPRAFFLFLLLYPFLLRSCKSKPKNSDLAQRSFQTQLNTQGQGVLHPLWISRRLWRPRARESGFEISYNASQVGTIHNKWHIHALNNPIFPQYSNPSVISPSKYHNWFAPQILGIPFHPIISFWQK